MLIVRYAFDRSARTVDENGHLHVAVANISKAAVNPYYGREIPNAAALGLDPTRIYHLLRDPGELAKGADSFAGLPILDSHTPVSADEPHRDKIVGSTGSGPSFNRPYLAVDLNIWDGDAIAKIENGERRQLSCGYRYDADMTPGVFDGVPYDGVMRNIRGNHVALVPVGRAGPDVVVGDQEMAAADALSTEGREDLKDSDFAVPGKRKLPIENEKHTRLAWDLLDDTDGLSAEEKAEARRRIKAAAKRFDIDTSDWKGAQDTAPDPNPKGQPMAASTRKARVDARVAALKPYLAQDADLDKLRLAFDAEEAKRDEDDKPKAEDDDDDDDDKKKAAEAKAKKAEDEEEDDKKKKAMDAAIAAAKVQARDEAVAHMQAVADAQRAVRPYVGDVHGMDSAAAIYGHALKELGVDTANVPPAAFPAMLKMVPLPGTVARPRVAMDAAGAKGFAERFPNAARIRVL